MKEKTLVPYPFCGCKHFSVIFSENYPRGYDINSSTFCCTSQEFGKHGPIAKCHEYGFLFNSPIWTHDFLTAQYRAVKDPDYLVHERVSGCSGRVGL